MAENSSIGGLWKKEKNGKKYYSGQIEIDGVKHNFACFHNGKKTKDNQPDYYIPKPRENNQATSGYETPEEQNYNNAVPDNEPPF